MSGCAIRLAFTLMFRKILKEILLSDVHGRLGVSMKHDEFKNKRSTLDLALALDIVVKEYGRKGKSCYQTFLDKKKLMIRLTAHCYGLNVRR